MRALSSQEIMAISGGTNFLDVATFQKIQDKAIQDAMVFSMITVPVAMAITLGLSASIVVTAAVGVVLAPYAAVFGYFHSNAWHIIGS